MKSVIKLNVIPSFMAERYTVIGAMVLLGLLFVRTSYGDFAAQLVLKLTPPDSQFDTRFGSVLTSVDNDILVGEPGRIDLQNGAFGMAYLFDGNTGALKSTFENPKPEVADMFARGIAGGGDRVFFGTTGLDERVYAFDAMNGNLLYQIDSPTVGGSNFGRGLVYDSGRLLVSAVSYENGGLSQVGRGFLYDTISGSLQTEFPNPEPEEFALFGASLALFGDKAAIGDPSRPDGRVWVFNQETGDIDLAIDYPHSGLPSGGFGGSLAANENIIVVGASSDGTSGVTDAGAVYVFDSQTGNLLHELYSPNSHVSGNFGRSIALTSRGDIVVGAWGEEIGITNNAGRVYLFDGQTGDLLVEIPNPEPIAGTGFGWSVSATQDLIVVGVSGFVSGIPITGSSPPTQGAAYVFAVVPEPSTICLVILPACVMLNKAVGARV